MRRRIAAVLALTLALAVAAPAPADDGDERSPCRVFADAIAQAKRTGALGRLLRTHRFTFTRRFYDHEGKEQGGVDMLMTYRLGVIPEENAIQLIVEVMPKGQGVQVRIAYVVGIDDGRLRRLDSKFPYGYVRARVRDGKIRVVRDLQGGTGEGKEEGQYDWDERTLPKIVGAFILPMLHDQPGVPDAVVYRDLDPFGTHRDPCTLKRAGRDDAGHLLWATDEGRQEPSTTLFVYADGERAGLMQRIRTISEVHVDPETKKEKVAHLADCLRQTRERFAELMLEYAPPKTPGAGD